MVAGILPDGQTFAKLPLLLLIFPIEQIIKIKWFLKTIRRIIAWEILGFQKIIHNPLRFPSSTMLVIKSC